MDPENGTVVINDGGTPDDISDDTVTYTPDSGFNNGTDTFEYTVCDAMDNCGTATVTITVGTPPMLEVVDDVASTDEDTPVEVDILANDTGIPDNGTLTTTDPENGTVVINDGGTPDDISDDTVTYTPDSGFNNGMDTFEYTVCDAMDNCGTATVTITVGTPPMLDAVDDVASTDEDTPVEVDILANDTGVPNIQTLTVMDPTNGTVVINDGGTPDDPNDDTVTYTPDSGFNNDTDTFEYTICDDMENCDTATVTITVGIPPTTIVAVDDDYTTIFIDGNIGGIIPDSNVLDNDTLNGEPVDPADVEITSEQTGPLTVDSDGTVIVAPETPTGSYSIEYTICEKADSGNCDTATVLVLVSEVQTVGIEVNQMVTPNNDGRNDFLFIRGVEEAKNNSLKIFNRWGIAVYEGQGYNNQNNVFDGRSKGRSTVSAQEYLPSGVYFYIFEYQKDNQNNITDSGYIFVSN
jgi:gliding motility-associated-like protein